MLEITFETFNIPSYGVAPQPVLSLYASGPQQYGPQFCVWCSKGICVEIGDGLTQIAPVFENYLIAPAFHKMNLGGCDLHSWHNRLLNEAGYTLNRTESKLILEKLSYVALDFNAEMEKAANTRDLNALYTLPDGREINLENERFRGPELFFNPGLNVIDEDGIGEATLKCIRKCPHAIQKEMFANIVVSGGSTMFPGFAERVERKIIGLSPVFTKVRVIAVPWRKYTAWIGGSIVTQLPTFRKILISREDYKQTGAGIVHRKFPTK
jgi:actin